MSSLETNLKEEKKNNNNHLRGHPFKENGGKKSSSPRITLISGKIKDILSYLGKC